MFENRILKKLLMCDKIEMQTYFQNQRSFLYLV